MEPRPIQQDVMIATEIIALSHSEEDDPFQAITASTIYSSLNYSTYDEFGQNLIQLGKLPLKSV